MIVAKDFYLIRTPLLSLDLLKELNELPHAHLNKTLQKFFSQACLQEAIYIASPDLYQELRKWQQGNLVNEKDVERLLLALLKYLLRMCTRCTPYGLFAGCDVGKPADVTRVKLAHHDLHKKHCRLDMNYVAELAAVISQMPEVQAQLRFYTNNSLYAIAGKYRYAEFKVKDKFRTYHLAEVACSEYLERVIAVANNGATLATLVNSIVNNDITAEEARSFVMEMVQSQLLVSELEPAVTGEEFFVTLTKKVQHLNNTSSISEKLAGIQNLLQSQTTGIEKYLQTHQLVKELLPDTNSKDLVQTDLFLATQQNTISANIIADIGKQVEKLWQIAGPYNNADLKSFIERFSERYEQQEIPLVLALDAEAGIGYAGYTGTNADFTPLIDDIFTTAKDEEGAISRGKMETFQLKKLHDCLRDNAVEIELTDKDLEELKGDKAPVIPDSFYIMGSILGKDGTAIDNGDYQFELNACAGPSAASLLGRFCHGHDELARQVRNCLREEEHYHPECIYAEVVHLPEARTGNVLLRPQLRDYEIVYLGKGSVSIDNQIPLSDLMISIRNNSIVLRSKKLNKQVIPRLSTAHHFSTGLPAYKFLCDLQFQGLHSGIKWHWNIPGNPAFLPRVRYKKLILSKRRWILNKKDYSELISKKSGEKINYVGFFNSTREHLQLPQYVVIAEGDNELLINMNNESCLYILADTLIKKGQVALEEFLETRDRCFVDGEHGRHTNEVIIPFKRAADALQSEAFDYTVHHKEQQFEIAALTLPKRSFITGSEWLYLKIYCGTSSAERILKGVVKPLTEQLIAENRIDKWFFLRYADPGTHIRLRFHHAEDKDFWKIVLERFNAAMQSDEFNTLSYKIQTDTYEREIERYGANTMELVEDIFYHDSEAVINCIDLLEGEEGEKYRWLLAARGVDMLLEDFDYDLISKAALLKKLQEGFYKEFGADKPLNVQLNDKYREHMQLLNSFLNPEKDNENDIEEAAAIFCIRSAELKNIAGKIKTLQAIDHNTISFDQFLVSYIHIFLNRMFLSNQRKHELVLYHFLSKYYESQIAKTKTGYKKFKGNGVPNL